MPPTRSTCSLPRSRRRSPLRSHAAARGKGEGTPPCAALLLVLVASGCGADASSPPAPDGAVDGGGDGGAQPPPRVCRPGTGWVPGRAAFVDRTAEWGLGGLSGRAFAAADLDADGFVDLIVQHSASPYDRTDDGRVFLSREAPGGARVFEDHTDASGLFAVRGGEARGRHASMIRLGDVDNDGDLDAFTGTFMYLTDAARTRLPDEPELLLNDGTGAFTLTAAPQIVPPRDPLTSDAVFFDQDLDGRLDLAIGYWWEQPAFTVPYGQQPQLFRGDGAGALREVTDEVGMTLPRTTEAVVSGTHKRPLFGLTLCDLDDDGRPDLVGATYGRMHNVLFLAEGDRFREVGAATLVGADQRLDYSDDESFRCYCRSVPTAAGCDGLPAPRYRCPLRGWLPGTSDQPWQLGGNTFSHACGDFDNDGDLDLYESNIRHPDVGSASDPSELIVNDGSSAGDLRFSRPGREAMGLVPPIDLAATDEGGQHAAAFDFDNDGRLDVLLAGSPYPRNRGWLFHQRAGAPLSFEWIGPDAGFSHPCHLGSAIADLDRDGDLDVVVGTYGCNDPSVLPPGETPDWVPPEHQPVRLYENVSNEGNFLSIRLRGLGAAGANADGLGARVRVTAGGVTQTRFVTTSSQNASFEPVAFFGLGASCDVERIEVRWPREGLPAQVFEGVLANYRVELREGEPAPRYLP